MKKPIALLVVLLFIGGCASAAVMRERAEHTFEKIFDAPGYSKDQIFERSKIWIAENFKSAKAVVEYENKEAGTIIGNGVIPYPCSGFECIGTGGWKAHFTMRVDIKDQRFRLTFSNLRLSWPPAPGRTSYDGPIGSENSLGKVRDALLPFGDQMLASFGKATKKDNW
jgi:hypothetical protein